MQNISFGTITAKELLERVVASGGRDQFPLQALRELKVHFPQLNGSSRALENAIRLAAREERTAATGQPAMPIIAKWLANASGDWKLAAAKQIRLLMGDEEGKYGHAVKANTNKGFVDHRLQQLYFLLRDKNTAERTALITELLEQKDISSYPHDLKQRLEHLKTAR